MEFRELKEFTKQITDISTDEELFELQIFLSNHPDAGKIIQGTGGARKIRMGIGFKGKSSGARIVYYWQDKNEIIWMLKAY